MPDKSTALPDDKRKMLDTQVRTMGDLSEKMDKSGDSSDWKSVREHQTAMHDSLEMMKGMYPAEAMRAHMHMRGMDSSSKGMPGMGGRMGGMGGKMPGPDNHPGPDSKPMTGGGMGGDR